MHNINEALSAVADKIDELIASVIEGRSYDSLLDAMRYSSIGGGKKVRAFLVVNSAKMFGMADAPSLYWAASAIEMVHSYSLIHDDLPCMDNSDMRRGRPSCHKRYGEATALLAGNALLTLAFEVLTMEEVSGDLSIRLRLIDVLAKAVGVSGMLAGQAMDMLNSNRALSFADIFKLQSMKTGKLFVASCKFGAILSGACESSVEKIIRYAEMIGIAFQIRDDLLDVSGKRSYTGKDENKDVKLGKSTSISCLGEDRALSYLLELKEEAIKSVQDFGDSAWPLIHLAEFIAERQS